MLVLYMLCVWWVCVCFCQQVCFRVCSKVCVSYGTWVLNVTLVCVIYGVCSVCVYVYVKYVVLCACYMGRVTMVFSFVVLSRKRV